MFACKSCTIFSTPSAHKMRAHFALCLTGPLEDPVPSDASFAEPSASDDSSASKSDNNYQKIIKTTALPTKRKKAGRPPTTVKVEKANSKVKKNPTAPRLRKVKAVGIRGGSLVKKRLEAESSLPAKSSSAVAAASTSSVSPAKRPVPTTVRPGKRLNASVCRKTALPTASVKGPDLEGKAVRFNGRGASCLVGSLPSSSGAWA